jgi:hypothetical protein
MTAATPGVAMTSDGVVATPTSHAIDHTGLVVGYVVGGLIMCLGGVVEILFGVKAEGQSLETVTRPLTAVES